MSSERKIKEMMAVVESWFEMVKESIIERGGDPDDGEFYDYDCEICGGPCVIIVHSGNSFSLSPGGDCCQSLIEKKRADLGIVVGAEASASIYFSTQKQGEGPNKFIERIRKNREIMS